MATRQEQARNLMVYEVIDAVLTANPGGAHKELVNNGFEFKYGQNGALSEKYLIQLYSNNEPLFWDIMHKIPVNSASIPPASRERLSAVVPTTGSSSSQRSDWWNEILNTLQGTSTSGGGETSTEETTTGAYVGYVIVILAIVGITIYMFRTIK